MSTGGRFKPLRRVASVFPWPARAGAAELRMRAEGTLTMRRVRAEEAREREARCARAERQSRRVLCAAQEYVDIIYELRLCRVWTECRAAYVVLRPRGALRGPPDSDCASAQGILYHTYSQRKQQSNQLTK